MVEEEEDVRVRVGREEGGWGEVGERGKAVEGEARDTADTDEEEVCR